jgi:hypothetical protein
MMLSQVIETRKRQHLGVPVAPSRLTLSAEGFTASDPFWPAAAMRPFESPPLNAFLAVCSGLLTERIAAAMVGLRP